MVASVIFLLILVVTHVYTQNIYEKIDRQESMIYYESLISTTDVLLLYPGYPEKWSQGNVEVLGIAERPNYINSTKMGSMMNMTEDRIKELMGIEGNNFYFTVENDTGLVFEKGTTAWNNTDTVYIINRNALMDGASVKIRFLVW